MHLLKLRQLILVAQQVEVAVEEVPIAAEGAAFITAVREEATAVPAESFKIAELYYI